jgi:lycopene beta-cyclase
MTHDVDLLILGGGCTGLSLSMKLAQFGQQAPSTLILEQRSFYENDRTWCFWGDEKTPFALQAQYQWPVVKVVNDGLVVSVDCANTPYRMLAAEQFYSAAVAAIATVPQLHLQMQSQVVSEPVFYAGRWHVTTSVGSASAAMLVDTRPQRLPATNGALMWQSFVGYEIDCSQPVFDANCAELMNFSMASTERVAFIYVLPLSRTRALVEFTVFSEIPPTFDALAADLDRAIAQRIEGLTFTVRRSEKGMLPMGLMPSSADVTPAPTSSYVRVGLFAGAARPATGYAFQRIQRWAAVCAKVISGGGLPVGHAQDPVLLAWMDSLFLKVIRHQPQLAPALFMRLFSHVSSDRAIRFLGDRGTFVDYMAMAWALPSRPFLQQLLVRS